MGKRILLLGLLLIASKNVFSICTSKGIYVKNQSHTINRNGLIILEFYAMSQDLVTELNKKHPVVLISNTGKKVKLKVVTSLIGEFQITQVALQPEMDLDPGEVYQLSIQNLPSEPNYYGFYNIDEFTFKSNSLVDEDVPVITIVPSEVKKELVYYGCGPAMWTHFSLNGKDESELFVLARVKNISANKETTCILNVSEGIVQIGHGMCSGEFYHEPGTELEVTFRLMDQSGNLGDWMAPVKFTAPVSETH